MDTARFRRLIDQYLGDEEVARIAAEARKGRKLLIGTTHLDAARPVVWDITRIAASGTPNSRQLIGDLILASSTLPGIFPPVRINVEANGAQYDELHVDGGVTSMLFLGPAGFDWKRVVDRVRVEGKPQVYVIRNARERPYLDAFRESISPMLERSASSMARDEGGQPEWEQVEPRVSPVLWRSMWSLFLTRGLEDPVRAFNEAQGDELALNLARIPADFGTTRTSSSTATSCGRCSSAAMKWPRAVIRGSGKPCRRLPPRRMAWAAAIPVESRLENGPVRLHWAKRGETILGRSDRTTG